MSKKDEIYFALICRIRFPHVQTESVGFSDGQLSYRSAY
jgi:hypothetical protein